MSAELALKFLGAEEDTKKPGKTKIILFLEQTELKAISDILVKNWADIEPGLTGDTQVLPKEVTKSIQKALAETGKPGDVALFGRMMASLPTVNAGRC